MTENVDSRWSPRSCTRIFLHRFWNEIPLFFPPHIIAHPARKRYARIADDKKIPTNNDHSFIGAFHMYTNDITSLWISSAVLRLLMYLFDHIWIIGLPIGPLLNNLPRVINVNDGEEERKRNSSSEERKKVIVCDVKNENSKMIYFTLSTEYLRAILVFIITLRKAFHH